MSIFTQYINKVQLIWLNILYLIFSNWVLDSLSTFLNVSQMTTDVKIIYILIEVTLHDELYLNHDHDFRFFRFIEHEHLQVSDITYLKK